MSAKKIKVYIVGGDKNYFKIFLNKSASICTFTTTSLASEADLAIFTGGSDVNPALYGEKKHEMTSFNNERDILEMKMFHYFLHLKIPMLGICRGAQFLTVMNGGKVIQDVSNHAISGTHLIECIDGNIISITSTHHQMMYPFNLNADDYLIVGWSRNNLSAYYDLDNDYKYTSLKKEPEIVFYDKTKCLCIQGHPELQSEDKVVSRYIKNTIINYLLI